MNILIKMKRAKSIAFVFTFFLFSLITGNFLSLNVTSAGKTTATVTYDYYVVAGYNMTPTPPSPAPSPIGFNFSGSPSVFNFGNITYWGGRTYLYEGWFGSNVHAFTMLNITNLLGHDITITNLTAEVTDGTPTKDFLFSPAGTWFGNYTLVIVDTLDPWNPVSPVDECNYYTGEVTVVNDGVDWWTKAVGTPYPEGWQTGPASLLEPDNDGDAEATNHIAPVQVVNGSTFTEYFGVVIFGDADLGTQINGTITLTLTYEYTVPGSPVASFIYSPTEPVVGETVTFNASASTPDGGNLTDPSSYVWNFGDETNGTGMIVTHKYTTPGTYAVVLNVTDSEGKWNSASKSVEVRPIPRVFWVPDNFTSIQEAINNVGNGDTISVRAGVYYENVIVSKSVSLVGEDKRKTIIEGNISAAVVYIYTSDVLVSNFTIRNGNIGVNVMASRCNIINNIITNNSLGIWLLSSADSAISWNNITNNNGTGVALFSSSNSTMFGNVINGNKYNLNVGGYDLGHFTHSIDVSNFVNGKPVYYLVNQKNLVFNLSNCSEVGYLAFVNCSNIVVEDQILRNNGQGLLLAYTSNSRITNCNLEDNHQGIFLVDSINNTLSRNNITNNEYGIYPVNSPNNTITRNNIADNSIIGVLLMDSNNVLTSNTFVNCGLLFYAYDLGSHRNLLENNVVNGKPLVYLEDVSDQTIENAGQVILVNCAGMRVENLALSNATVGIELWGTTNTRIAGNNLTDNYYGILTYQSSNDITGNQMVNNSWGVWLMNSTDSAMSGNTLTNNEIGIDLMMSEGIVVERNSVVGSDIGINIYLGGHNLLMRNNISSNTKAISLLGASDNKICHNNFVDNEIQVELNEYFGNVKNTWDNDYPSGGNYWSDHDSTDLLSSPDQNLAGSDGITDTRYQVDEDNIDKYPLAGPISFFNAGTWNDTIYHVDTVSNSTISDFYFNPDEGPLISFNVTGSDETLGFSRITIPKELLWCDSPEEWQVWVNNTIIEDRKIIEDKNCTYIYFTYNHTTQNVEVLGVHVIPEFSPGTSMLLILTILTVAIVFYKRRVLKTPNR